MSEAKLEDKEPILDVSETESSIQETEPESDLNDTSAQLEPENPIEPDPMSISDDAPIPERTKNSPALVWGLVIAVAAAAFMGGFAVGNGNDDSLTREDISGIVSDELRAIIQSAPPVPTQQPPQSAQPPGPVQVSADDDPIKGNPDAKITIIEFSDFECPFCKRFYQETLPLLEQNYIDTGLVNLVYRDMPLEIHPNAVPAHVAAECADEQGAFWPYHDILFDRSQEWSRLGPSALEAKLAEYAQELGLHPDFDACFNSAEVLAEIQNDYTHAIGYGITGTPTFFIGNDAQGYIRLSGAQPYEAFAAVIDPRLG